MGETGIIVRLPGTLNPTAEEFTPANHIPVTVPVAVGVPYPCFPAGNFSSPSHLSTSPTRSLLLTPVPLTSESILWRDLEKFGNVRAVQTEALRYGIVTVHFYDLRHAETAYTAIRTHNVHYTSFFNSVSHPQLYAPPPPPPPPGLVAGCPLWAHFVLPAASDAFPDAHNQGTIVVFNLDSNVSAHHLRQLFETFGISLFYLLFIIVQLIINLS